MATMDFAAVLQALNQVSGFELYRLRAAILTFSVSIEVPFSFVLLLPSRVLAARYPKWCSSWPVRRRVRFCIAFSGRNRQ
mgnify:CR=1 FL=1